MKYRFLNLKNGYSIHIDNYIEPVVGKVYQFDDWNYGIVTNIWKEPDLILFRTDKKNVIEIRKI